MEYQGRQVDPRYRFTNQRIIEELKIDDEEERHMKTIISDDERRRRAQEKTKRERRESGEVEMSRKEYLTKAAKRRAAVRKLTSEGLSLRQIGK